LWRCFHRGIKHINGIASAFELGLRFPGSGQRGITSRRCHPWREEDGGLLLVTTLAWPCCVSSGHQRRQIHVHRCSCRIAHCFGWSGGIPTNLRIGWHCGSLGKNRSAEQRLIYFCALTSELRQSLADSPTFVETMMHDACSYCFIQLHSSRLLLSTPHLTKGSLTASGRNVNSAFFLLSSIRPDEPIYAQPSTISGYDWNLHCCFWTS